MRSLQFWQHKLLLLLLASSLGSFLAAADSTYLTHGEGEGFKCAGIYGSPGERKGRRSVIEIEVPPVPPSDIALAIFNFPDSKWIGLPIRNGAKVPDDEVGELGAYISSRNAGRDASDVQRFVICDNETITMNLCTEADLGRPLINDRDDSGNPRSFASVVYSDYLMLSRSGIGYTRLEDKERTDKKATDGDAWHAKARTTVVDGATLEWAADGTLTVRYYVNTTGFYCVDAASTGDFNARVEWHNVNGLLPASEYPKMHVYMGLMIAYILIALAWAFMSWRVWSEILPVQNQLLGLIVLLAVDMGMNFGFWKYYNSTGTPSIVYSVFTLVIDAGRNSLSFFMLLVVSLGWGVVRPSLGKTMIRCVLLAIVHFTAGCLYGAGILFRDPHESGPLGLIYVIPLSMSLSLFYIWIMSSIITTINMLAERQQTYKLAMYTRLWRLLLVCLVLLFGFFVLNIVYTLSYSRILVAARSWQWLWFWTDGWLNLEYFVALCVILYWWRPTMENYRYGLEELAGDEIEAAEREQAFIDHDSFDNPRMGENLELDDMGEMPKPRSASVSGDAVQFVINDDDDDEDDDRADAATANKTSPPRYSD
ncbi:hypothetical protein LPJ77_001210 [Coemansia sp. RSA 2523]|nr:hypothetical protein LPJ77_001210 [Coemansia sp. RSA 2523]KAJ2133533.1 hypothetical protein GGF48_000036 [Coemansia sp. RSA 921]KAJ2145460.1 hypothetical protein IW142_002590 [Coemansia sp. RSA 564]KAJ2256597.1 hypothetical protein GGH98_001412 [Coemansia sp. RSA 454]KAJ2281763.1 hypothetical protein EV176_000249 [Coemansia sp. RSA 451]KAJ2534139.1 hypothetical protein GGH20_000178 [Coemansia sp. RSA 1937]KAJ2575810.1 hypothetical protein GGH19_002685 [Coemansia sp. RSA 1807]KAJ2651597.1 